MNEHRKISLNFMKHCWYNILVICVVLKKLSHERGEQEIGKGASKGRCVLARTGGR